MYDGPSRSSSIRDTSKRSSPATASSHISSRSLGARVVLDLTVRRPAPTGIEHDVVELQLHQRLLRTDQVTDVRRVECSSEDSYAQTGYSRT